MVPITIKAFLAACLVTGIAASTSTHQRIGDVTEFPVSSAQELAAITAGADGNLWVIDPRTSKIIRMTPSGKATEFQLPASSYPADITAGPDGNVWYARRGEIGKITPSGQVTPYKVDGLLSGITAGPDGNIWFCENFRGKIGRATTSGQVTMFDIPTRAGGGSSNPLYIAAGPDGNLWFTESHPKANKIGSVTPDGKFTEYALPHEGTPRGIAAGPDGNMWAVQSVTHPEEDRVIRITPSGTITEFVLPSVLSSMAQTIVSGPDDNLWFTEPNNPSTKVSRITTKGELTRFPVPTKFSGPAGLTVGPDGNLWFTERAKSKIARLHAADSEKTYVLYLPSGFVPATLTVELGGNVKWINKMPGQSNIRRLTSPPDFESSVHGTGQHYTYKFNLSGTYRYSDQRHDLHRGTVIIPMKAVPLSGPTTTKFSITWGVGSNPFLAEGYVVDVDVLVPGKTEFSRWQDAVTKLSGAFEPKDGSGTYKFRSRLRQKTGEAFSDWSPELIVIVN